MVDFPRAWEIAKASGLGEHHINCSYRTAAMMCDCHVLYQHPEYLSDFRYGPGGLIGLPEDGVIDIPEGPGCFHFRVPASGCTVTGPGTNLSYPAGQPGRRLMLTEPGRYQVRWEGSVTARSVGHTGRRLWAAK